MSIRVAINVFDRIGRNLVLCSIRDLKMEIVGVNEITSLEALAHLLKYDSVLECFYGDAASCLVRDARRHNYLRMQICQN
jgi:glyceraldehyde 3-phosphate dehydrogenase